MMAEDQENYLMAFPISFLGTQFSCYCPLAKEKSKTFDFKNVQCETNVH